MRNRLIATAISALLALGASMSAPAQAGLFVVPGTSNTNTDNVISSATCAPHVNSGNAINGCLNSAHDHLVLFSVPVSQSIVFAAGGQAARLP